MRNNILTWAVGEEYAASGCLTCPLAEVPGHLAPLYRNLYGVWLRASRCVVGLHYSLAQLVRGGLHYRRPISSVKRRLQRG